MDNLEQETTSSPETDDQKAKAHWDKFTSDELKEALKDAPMPEDPDLPIKDWGGMSPAKGEFPNQTKGESEIIKEILTERGEQV